LNSLKLAYFIVNFKRVVKSQDEDVVKPVVVEKNHPVEVHLQQKIDDQPSETSAENVYLPMQEKADRMMWIVRNY